MNVHSNQPSVSAKYSRCSKGLPLHGDSSLAVNKVPPVPDGGARQRHSKKQIISIYDQWAKLEDKDLKI